MHVYKRKGEVKLSGGTEDWWGRGRREARETCNIYVHVSIF